MAWKDWKKEVPKVTLDYGCYDIKRRVTGQKHVLFRLVDAFTIHNVKTNEDLELPAGTLSDGSSVPGVLWGALDADPADLLLPGFAHDYAYRKGAKWKKPGGSTRKINRYEADLLHIAVSRLMKVKKADQAKIWYALRVGGLAAYHDKTVPWDGKG